MIKKLIFCFLCLFTIFSITNKVSAEELTDFCDYTEPCWTNEDIDEFISNNVDTSVNDAYLLILHYKNSKYGLYMAFFNSNDMKNKNIYVDTTSYITFKASNILNLNASDSKKVTTINQFTLYNSNNPWLFGLSKEIPENYTYLANVDILDQDGNVLFAQNVGNIEIEEEPITIINKMALFVNDIIVYFNKNNISFYQILIGLFVFNFLVYVICYIIRKF